MQNAINAILTKSLLYYTINYTKCSNLLYAMKYKQMLGKLMGSNARVKILRQFISHPDDKFYIRQLSRDLKLQLNSVRRELENLP